MAVNAGRTRFIPLVAVAGILLLSLIGAVLQGGRGASATAAAGLTSPGYLRINVSDKSTVYLEFKGGELRAAMKAEALKTATAFTMRLSPGNMSVQHAAITLPIPAEQLPNGITEVKASVVLYPAQVSPPPRSSPFVTTEITISRPGDQNALWQYGTRAGSHVGDSPEKAPAIQLPRLDKLTLSLDGKPVRGSLGLGVRLMAGTEQLLDVRKDGKPVDVHVAVLDASGRQIASKAGPLSAFGFS